jgi:hypothetical protein
MAIARGAGTEIIRTAMFNNVTNSACPIISGEQHHIYTVLSIVVCCMSVATDRNYIHCQIQGYDSLGGTINSTQHLFYQDMSQFETFVWNDKFSFTGWQSTDESAGLGTDEVKQDALADQGGAAQQYLAVNTEGVDNMDVFVTFIDQNNE